MIKITFISSFWNNFHIIGLCEALNKMKDVDFKYIATVNNPNSLQKHLNDDVKYSFVIETYQDDGERIAKSRIEDSDVVIIGSAPDYYIENRLKNNKLTFRYSERFNKKGKWTLLYLPRTIKLLLRHTKYKNKKYYLLCASAYASYDFSLIGAYINKCFKWGYFPKLSLIDDLSKAIKEKKSNSILWVGRLIDWKHPEDIIEIAKRLKKDGYQFKLNIIGKGSLYDNLKEKIKKLKLNNYITLLKDMTNEEVQEYMKTSQIFVATSDFNEGWGVVINEAMGNACAVIASKAMGAVPYLIKDGINGYSYSNRNINELYDKIKYLLDNKNVCSEISKKAYETIENVWNGEEAAKRFVQLSKDMIKQNDCKNYNCGNLYKDGPCSKASIIKNNSL